MRAVVFKLAITLFFVFSALAVAFTAISRAVYADQMPACVQTDTCDFSIGHTAD